MRATPYNHGRVFATPHHHETLQPCRNRVGRVLAQKGNALFTGLVQCLGTVKDTVPFGKGRRFRIDIDTLGPLSAIGQSIAVNGVCLTITSKNGDEATFDAVAETVSRSNLGRLKAGDRVNLEPALKAGDALDGHIVLGHVDALAAVVEIDAASQDSRIVKIQLPKAIRHLVSEKGSVAVDGISLTIAQAGEDWFTVSVIPHSWSNSTLSRLQVGDGVNLEADVLARYAARILQYPPSEQTSSEEGLSETFLRENGFA